MKEIKPYVGITGFKTPEDVERVTKQYEEHGLPEGYTAMYGILVSEKRLSNPTKKGSRSPSVINIESVAKAVPKDYLAMLHYHQKENFGFGEVVGELVQQSGANSVQLNIAWPKVEEINYLKENGIIVTFQLPSRAISEFEDKELSSKLQEYSGVDYVLVDLSGGKGIPFDVERSNNLLSIVKESLPESCLGIAGGLNPINLCEKMNSLNYSNLMFDAESGLMQNKSLDMNLTDQYIKEASGL